MITQLGILRRRSIDPPVTGQFLEIGTGTSLIYNAPNNWGFKWSKSAFIWTAAEMGATKTIDYVGFYHRSYGTFPNFSMQTLKIGHVAQSSFATSNPPIDLSDLTITDLTTVSSNFTHFIFEQNNLWHPILFTNNFVYNGVSNLILIWEHNAGDWSSTAGGSDGSTQANKGITSGSMTSASTIPAVGTILTKRPNVKFHY
jgi:hypothetical protein